MRFITDFADQAVTLPVAFAVAAILVGQRNLRQAAIWCTMVAGCFSLVLALKLLLAACGPAPDVVFGGPSGHTVAGTLVYGGLLALLGVSAWITILVSSLLAILIGWSRISLGAHPPIDVLFGIAIGVAGVAVLVALLRRLPARQATAPRRAGIGAIVVVLALLLHGQRLQAEPVIRGVAQSYVRALLGCEAGSTSIEMPLRK